MELVERVELMVEVYCKGFGGSTAGIDGACQRYLRYKPDNPEEYKEKVLLLLNHVENHYASLDFSKLDSNADFAPIFVVKELLLGFGRDVRRFLDDPSPELLSAIQERQHCIRDVGHIYAGNLSGKLSELRKISGYEDFHITFVDSLTGIEWKLSDVDI
jgi:hypothetical protein